MTSATSFWPETVADLIASYQARFAADARALTPTAPAPAAPPSPAEPAGAHVAAEIAAVHGGQDGPWSTAVAAPPGDQDGPETLTALRPGPVRPPVPVPARPLIHSGRSSTDRTG